MYNRFSLFHFVFECKTNLHLIAFNSLFSLHLITKWNFLFEWHHYNESQSMRLLAYSPVKSSTKITSHEMLQRSTHSFGIWFVVRMYCEEDGVFFLVCFFFCFFHACCSMRLEMIEYCLNTQELCHTELFHLETTKIRLYLHEFKCVLIHIWIEFRWTRWFFFPFLYQQPNHLNCRAPNSLSKNHNLTDVH